VIVAGALEVNRNFQTRVAEDAVVLWRILKKETPSFLKAFVCGKLV